MPAAPARIAVFGGITVDRIATASGPLVAGASNPGRLVRRPGGVGLNVAAILASLGHRVRLAGRVGNDDDGRLVTRAAEAPGIDTGGIAVSAAQPTASYTAIFDRDGDLVAGIADMAVFDEITPATIDGATLGYARNGFAIVDANLPPDALRWLAENAKTAGARIAAMAVSPAKAPRLEPALELIDVLFANRREAAVLTGRDPDDDATADELATALAERGPAAAVVTAGNAPLAFATAEGVGTALPPPVDVTKNVNGAGDSLAAGAIHDLAAGGTLRRAIRTGLAAAALTLENGGIAEAMFSPDRLATMAEVLAD